MDSTIYPWSLDSTGPSNQSYPTGINLRFSPYTTAFYVAIYTPLCFCIIFGNLLVMLAFWYNKELRKVQNYLLISLSFNDILTGIFALPPVVAVRLLVSSVTCFSSTRFMFYLPSIVFCGSSIHHLLAIAVDRCLSLKWPLQYPRIVTMRRVTIVMSIIWMVNLSLACLPLYYPSPEVDHWVCVSGDRYESEVDTLFLFITGLLPFYVFCLLVLYAVMLRVAFRHIEKRRELTNHIDTTAKDTQARRRGIVTMAVVVGAFAVCWIPTSLKGIYETFAATTEKKQITVQTFAEYVSFANSMVNPIIYGYFNPQFKIGFRMVLTAWGCLKAKKPRSKQQLPAVPGTDNISLSKSSEKVGQQKI